MQVANLRQWGESNKYRYLKELSQTTPIMDGYTNVISFIFTNVLYLFRKKDVVYKTKRPKFKEIT